MCRNVHRVRAARGPGDQAGVRERDRKDRAAAGEEGRRRRGDRVARAEPVRHPDREVTRCDALRREPRDALLHEVEPQRVRADRQGRDHRDRDDGALPWGDVNR